VVETQQRSAAEISRAEFEARDMGAVVDIYDQIYQLRGVNPEYIERLASVVDTKMRAVSAHGATVDSLRVAVLAALNLADELMTLRGRYDALSSSVEVSRQSAAQSMVRTRAGSLMGMLDDVLQERKAG
jgi:cell division protein ZapA